MQLLRAVVGPSLEQVRPPELTHPAHEVSAKHVETCAQQLCSRHAPHGVVAFRYCAQFCFIPCCIPAPHLELHELSMQLLRVEVGPSLLEHV
jgi:hypothetical protein